MIPPFIAQGWSGGLISLNAALIVNILRIVQLRPEATEDAHMNEGLFRTELGQTVFTNTFN